MYFPNRSFQEEYPSYHTIMYNLSNRGKIIALEIELLLRKFR